MESAVTAGRPPPSVVLWLVVVLAMVFGMVLLGGITRLTGSGLSMVEWHPLMGALPPLNQAEWQAVFGRYQDTPQFQLVNDWMSLEDFKRIFFWEYLHRLAGRAVGLVFFVPWVVLVARRQLRGRWIGRTLVAGVLGGLQGLLGWYMVKSGLVDVPNVSHYRLAAHLGLAFVVAGWLAWLLFMAVDPEPGPGRAGVARGAWWLLSLLGLQIVYGAFMAGTRAGHLYATFPTLHGEWVPEAAFAGWSALTADPVTIHFLHRTLGYLVAVVVGLWWWRARRAAGGRGQRRVADLTLGLVVLQVVLGIATVMGHVPLAAATTHQVVALLLLLAVLYGAYAFAE